MTITLTVHLEPEQHLFFEKQARLQGKPIEEFLEETIIALTPSQQIRRSREAIEETFDSIVASGQVIPVLRAEFFERESLYAEHDG